MENLETIHKQLQSLGCTLQPYTQEDEKGLYEIFKAVVASGCQFPYEDSSIEEFHRLFVAPRFHVFVCKRENEVVGGFYIRANLSGRSSHIANCAYMVHENYRGQGLGTLLIKASFLLAKELGFQAMQYNMVLSENVKAIKLYQKLGFAIVGTIPNAVRNPNGSFQDGHIMYRSLA